MLCYGGLGQIDVEAIHPRRRTQSRQSASAGGLQSQEDIPFELSLAHRIVNLTLFEDACAKEENVGLPPWRPEELAASICGMDLVSWGGIEAVEDEFFSFETCLLVFLTRIFESLNELSTKIK
jgi:hypothetical protein